MKKINLLDVYLDYPYIGALAIDKYENDKSKKDGKR
jgi:hypothetical protein